MKKRRVSSITTLTFWSSLNLRWLWPRAAAAAVEMLHKRHACAVSHFWWSRGVGYTMFPLFVWFNSVLSFTVVSIWWNDRTAMRTSAFCFPRMSKGACRNQFHRYSHHIDANSSNAQNWPTFYFKDHSDHIWAMHIFDNLHSNWSLLIPCGLSWVHIFSNELEVTYISAVNPIIFMEMHIVLQIILKNMADFGTFNRNNWICAYLIVMSLRIRFQIGELSLEQIEWFGKHHCYEWYLENSSNFMKMPIIFKNFPKKPYFSFIKYNSNVVNFQIFNVDFDWRFGLIFEWTNIVDGAELAENIQFVAINWMFDLKDRLIRRSGYSEIPANITYVGFDLFNLSFFKDAISSINSNQNTPFD